MNDTNKDLIPCVHTLHLTRSNLSAYRLERNMRYLFEIIELFARVRERLVTRINETLCLCEHAHVFVHT